MGKNRLLFYYCWNWEALKITRTLQSYSTSTETFNPPLVWVFLCNCIPKRSESLKHNITPFLALETALSAAQETRSHLWLLWCAITPRCYLTPQNEPKDEQVQVWQDHPLSTLGVWPWLHKEAEAWRWAGECWCPCQAVYECWCLFLWHVREGMCTHRWG